MKKKIISILMIMTLIVSLIGCSSKNEPKEPPDINITIDNQGVDYVIGKNQWNGHVYDREDTFKTILKEGSNIVIPYIELGKTVMIDFKNYPPDTIK
ncbi:MAG: hypothetical protein AB1420_16670 [Bacillota bacterium]